MDEPILANRVPEAEEGLVDDAMRRSTGASAASACASAIPFRQKPVSQSSSGFRGPSCARRSGPSQRFASSILGTGGGPVSGRSTRTCWGLSSTMRSIPTRCRSSRSMMFAAPSKCALSHSRRYADRSRRLEAINAHAVAMRQAFSRPDEAMEHDIAFHSSDRRRLAQPAFRPHRRLVQRRHPPDLAHRLGQPLYRRGTTRQRRVPRAHRRGDRGPRNARG